jgi:tRNA pseudouridine38-40 synthase
MRPFYWLLATGYWLLSDVVTPMHRVLKITLSYDGTAYVGWQRQAAGLSIQGLLEDALTRLEGAPVTAHGAGRTDAGVHALGQVASARVSVPHDPAVLKRALNGVLPPDVRVIRVEDAPPDFHARYSASGKTYEYRIWQGDVQPPLARTWSWHVPRTLDVAAMDRAARVLEGRHDFSAFQSTGSNAATSIRTVTSCRVRYEAPDDLFAGSAGGSLVILRIEADGFLRHMVRAIAGTLVEIGESRRDAGSTGALLASGNRSASGATAPAHGLVLIFVAYAALPTPR